MIQFYGAPMSSAGRTHWMLEEVGVPYEYHRVKLRDEAASAELRKINPAGTVPFLVDGDLRLGESCAINFYLAETYKQDLIPPGVIGRSRALYWSFWAMTNLQPVALDAMFAMIPATDRPPGRGSPEALPHTKATAARLLDYLESQLDGYLVGSTFSVADVIAGSVVNVAIRGNAATPGPKTLAWMEGLRARPPYQAAIAKSTAA
jgi:glutathione S-transferase